MRAWTGTLIFILLPVLGIFWVVRKSGATMGFFILLPVDPQELVDNKVTGSCYACKEHTYLLRK